MLEHNEFMRGGIKKGMSTAQQIIANPQGQYSQEEVEAARVKYENLTEALKMYTSTTAEQIMTERTGQIKKSFIEIDKILREYIEDRQKILQKNIELLEDSVMLEGLDPTMYGIERMASKQSLFDSKLRQLLAPNEDISSRLLLQNMRDLMEGATDDQTKILEDLEKLLSEGFELQLQRLDAEIKELDRTILSLRNAPSTSQNLESLSAAIEQRIEKNLDQFMFGTSGQTRETNMIDTIKQSLGLSVSGSGSGGNQPLGLFASQSARIKAGLADPKDWRRLGIGEKGETYDPKDVKVLEDPNAADRKLHSKWAAVFSIQARKWALKAATTDRDIKAKELAKKAVEARGGDTSALTIAILGLKKTLEIARERQKRATTSYEDHKAKLDPLGPPTVAEVNTGTGSRVPKHGGALGKLLFSLNEKMFGKKGQKPQWQQDVEKEVGFEFAMRKGYQPFGQFTRDVFGDGGGGPEGETESVWRVEREKLEEQAKLMNLSVEQKKKWVEAMLKQQKKFEDETIRLAKIGADAQFEQERRKLYLMKKTGVMPQAINAQREVAWQAGRRAWQTAAGSLEDGGIPGAQGMNVFSPVGEMKGHINKQIGLKRVEALAAKKQVIEFGDSPEGRAAQKRAEAADAEVERLNNLKKVFKGLAKDGQSLADAWEKIKIKTLKDDIIALEEKIKLDELDPNTLNRETMEDRREQTRKRIKDHQYSINDSFDDIFANWKYGMEEMTIDMDEALYNMSGQFRSGIATAFGEAIKGTKTLREAFEDMFMKLADYALDEFLKATVNRIFGSLAGSAGGGAEGGMVRGGSIQKFAQGGMVTGGTGNKDDVPAFLKNGEYVLRKAAVKKYGVSLLDLLNNEAFGQVNKFEVGGAVRAGRGTGRVIGDPQLGEPMYIHYPDGSRTLVSEMTSLRRQRGLPTYTHTDPDPGIFSRANYDVDYWTHLAEPTTHGGLGMSTEDIAKIKKQWEENAFADPQEGLTSRIQHGKRGRWVDYNLRNAFIYDSDKFPTLDHSYFSIDKRLTRQALTDDNNPRNKIRQEKAGKLYKYYEDRASDLIQHAEAVAKWERQKKKRMKYTLYAAAAGMGLNFLTGGGWGVSTPGSAGTAGGNIWSWLTGASGGLVSGGKQLKKASGGLIGDTVPAMLMGGEYVINRNAVQKYGSDFFTQLNKQTVPGFAEGGYVGGNGVRENKNGNVKDFDSAPESQGDTTNNIEINVNVSSDGKVSTDAVSADGMSPQRARELGNMIRQQVVDTIIQQKRQGGILHSSLQQQ
tara:strand:- start:8719 stop:12522 length:3804 start_codon:yes stop_codon:yes gene_type:complete